VISNPSQQYTLSHAMLEINNTELQPTNMKDSDIRQALFNLAITDVDNTPSTLAQHQPQPQPPQ